MFGVSHGFPVWVFLKSIGAGFLIGALYLLFMLLRKAGAKHPAAVFFQDVLFCAVAALVSFLFVFDVNAGVGRFYIFAGEGIGCTVFYYFYCNNLNFL